MLFVFRRESPWKVEEGDSTVSSKLKLLQEELTNLEKLGKGDLSKVSSLMRKQAKRYQSLTGKIDDLCRRMVSDHCLFFFFFFCCCSVLILSITCMIKLIVSNSKLKRLVLGRHHFSSNSIFS